MIRPNRRSRQDDFMAILLDISRQLAETRTLDPLLDYAIDIALDLFNAERGYLILLNDDGSLAFHINRAQDGRKLENPKEEISRTILQQVVRERQDLVIADAISHSAFQSSESVVLLGIRSVLCVPLIARGEVLGALYLENRSLPNMFTEDDLQPLKLFASQAAVAIENAALNEDLETRVAARTAELQSRNEELDAFAHTVAHDLKSPLTTILGYAELVRDSRSILSEQERQDYMNAIGRTALKMGYIIEALLLLASVSQQEVPLEPLDTNRIVNQVLQRLTEMIHGHQAEITLPDHWPVALGHAPWVEEIWVNYVSNALKYGGTPPCLELGADRQPDGMVRFWVRDKGPGLTAQERARLFTPFTQLNRVRTEGQGLGLSIVQRIVAKLGGGVDAESAPGQGSTFSFTLPGR